MKMWKWERMCTKDIRKLRKLDKDRNEVENQEDDETRHGKSKER